MKEVLLLYFHYYAITRIMRGHWYTGVPITFLLGFYVSLVVKRWWEQYCKLPWPDTIAYYLAGLVVTHVPGEARVRARMVRRTVVRYCILAYILCIRKMSTRLRKRFPSIHELVKTGIIRADEVSGLAERESQVFPDLRPRELDRRSPTVSSLATGGCLSRFSEKPPLTRNLISIISVERGDPEQSSQGRSDHQRPWLQPHDGQVGRLPSLSMRGGRLRAHPRAAGLHPGRPSGSLRLLCCLHHWGTVAHLEKGRRQTWLAPFNLIWFYSAITNFLLRLGTRRLTSTTRYSWRSGSSSSSAGSGWPRPSTIPSARTMRTLSWMNSSTGKFIGKFELKLVKSWNLSFSNDYIRCFPTELPSDISTWRWVWWTSTRWERGPTLMIWLFPCCRTPRS